jgi:hypothetical protein
MPKSLPMWTSRDFWEWADEFNAKYRKSKKYFTDQLPKFKGPIEKMITDEQFAKEVERIYKESR